MSKKSDTVESLREQVVRLTERLEGVQDSEKLSLIIREMQLQAKGQQEEIEHLRKKKALYDQAIDAGSNDQFKENSKLTQQIQAWQKTIAVLKKENERLTTDNMRLTDRLSEIARGAEGL